MIICLATKPLNDGTKGFRFNFAGVKGLTRKRKTLSRGFKVNIMRFIFSSRKCNLAAMMIVLMF